MATSPPDIATSVTVSGTTEDNCSCIGASAVVGAAIGGVIFGALATAVVMIVVMYIIMARGSKNPLSHNVNEAAVYEEIDNAHPSKKSVITTADFNATQTANIPTSANTIEMESNAAYGTGM